MAILLLPRLRCLVGLHEPIALYSHWKNSSSGAGFYVSKCLRCDAEMTKAQGSPWRPIASIDRE
jgi:hypothetical protein